MILASLILSVTQKLTKDNTISLLYLVGLLAQTVMECTLRSFDQQTSPVLRGFWTHGVASGDAVYNVLQPHIVQTQIAKTFRSTSIRHRSDTKASDRCLIDIDPGVFAVWEGAPTSISQEFLFHLILSLPVMASTFKFYEFR